MVTCSTISAHWLFLRNTAAIVRFTGALSRLPKLKPLWLMLSRRSACFGAGTALIIGFSLPSPELGLQPDAEIIKCSHTNPLMQVQNETRCSCLIICTVASLGRCFYICWKDRVKFWNGIYKPYHVCDAGSFTPRILNSAAASQKQLSVWIQAEAADQSGNDWAEMYVHPSELLSVSLSQSRSSFGCIINKIIFIDWAELQRCCTSSFDGRSHCGISHSSSRFIVQSRMWLLRWNAVSFSDVSEEALWACEMASALSDDLTCCALLMLQRSI